MSGKVLLIGLGSLGGHVLEFLARTHGIKSIVAADTNEEWGISKLNNAQLGAATQGYYPRMQFRKIDLNSIDETTQILKEEDPDVIFNATTLQSWWAITLLPRDVYMKLLEAGGGPWIPNQLTLAYKLMTAVKRSGISAHVINASFPDAVNPVLAKVGLAPLVGIGNTDLVIPYVKKYVSEKLKVPMSNVTVFLVAQHYIDPRIEEFGSTMGAPYFLKILVGDRNVTSLFDPNEIWAGPLPTPAGNLSDQRVAASAVKNIAAIINDTNEITHSPGPKGLPGGYPIRLSADGVEVILPEELTLDEAIKINEECQRFDGIERIENDGTVVFTNKSASIMKEMLGYDCRPLKIDDSETRAKELRALYMRFANKFTTAVQ